MDVNSNVDAKISMHAYRYQNAMRTYATAKGNVDTNANGNVEKYRKENYDEYINNLKIKK